MPKRHIWVEMKMTPVEVEEVDGRLDIYAHDAAIEASEEDTRYGCWFCFTPLTLETFRTECTHATVSG